MVVGHRAGAAFSAANVFFRDVSNVGQILTNFVRFGVPMIYPYTMVAGPVRRRSPSSTCSTRSPTRCCCSSRRSGSARPSDPAATAAKHIPDNLWALRPALAVLPSVILLGIGQLVFSRLENKIPERL